MESQDPLRPELRKILTIIADLTHNNTEAKYSKYFNNRRSGTSAS
jgi:hypothetical protein